MELLTFAKLKNAVFLDYGSSYPYFLIEAAKIKGNYLHNPAEFSSD
jgi:hypothetical protein